MSGRPGTVVGCGCMLGAGVAARGVSGGWDAAGGDAGWLDGCSGVCWVNAGAATSKVPSIPVTRRLRRIEECAVMTVLPHLVFEMDSIPNNVSRMSRSPPSFFL
jgi:hypothetical protein